MGMLDDKVAIVTGAGNGVGRGEAILLADHGAKVVVNDLGGSVTGEGADKRAADEVVDVIKKRGGDAAANYDSVADFEGARNIIGTALDTFGRLDILVNNAAITFPGDLDVPLKRYDLMMAVNLRAPLVAAHAAVPHMRQQGEGAILNVSSAAALMYVPGLMVYGMSKIAMEHLTVSLAAQLAADRVAVNTFRIDLPVASEGFVANAPDFDHSDWEPTEVPAEGIVWMLRQPPPYTGLNVGMRALRDEAGIMASRVRSQGG